ncbi:MAG: C10 family peptidase [Bacteroidales bacterium]|nr:C10 family peptidase [Bacteroidales bacterium]
MKHLITLLLTLSLFTASAAKVSLEQAMLVGKNFFVEQTNRHNPVDYNQLNIRGTLSEFYQGEIAYYALNFDQGGWVVVSSEDAVVPVLAYSFDGMYSRADQPPQFISWMEGYARQIAWLREHDDIATEEVAAIWNRLSTMDPATLDLFQDSRDVAPMLTSTWNQGSPYNFLCPADAAGPGGHVYAGCVATAMAQVLYYYRWPVTGNGQHCYNPSGYPQQCADFTNTTYPWNEMVNSTSSKDTAMALIQWHCGIAVNMMYSPGGSGAYSEDAAAALRTYFKYHPNTVLLYKENYTEEQWADILIANLDARRPMYYHGFGSGGHAFNVDGYQGSDYFHFNWGWGGSYNGYYYLTNLNPGGSNFTEGQGAIVNIYPDTLSYTYPAYCSGQTTLSRLKGTFDDGSCPENYQENSDCSWLISPQSNSDSVVSITISFQRFSTELNTDIVTIYEGATPDGDILAQYSGNDIPASVTVEGSEALVTFTSNENTNEPGWFASYTSETMDWCSGITTYTEPQGSLSDGSFDYQYKNNAMCRWKIIPNGDGPLTLTFSSFRTESDYDILRIYDLGSETLIATCSGIYSGSDVPPPVVAQSGQMFLIFSTNSSETEAGWEAHYTTYPVALEENPSETSVAIYPNPAKNLVNVEVQGFRSQELKLELTDVNGKMNRSVKLDVKDGVSHEQLDVSSLPAGVYFLRITGNEGTLVRKLILE